MANVPTKVAARLSSELKRFQPILSGAKARDVNESDTALLVTDVLTYVFGFDKYTEITSEYAIKSTYCDLAIKLDGKLELLIEVKAIGTTLDEKHMKQAVDYAANQGVEWAILTNGTNWKAYRVTFGKPIGQELVMDVDLLGLSHRNRDHVEMLHAFTKEGILKSALHMHHQQRQAMNRFTLGAILQTDAACEMLRREIRRLNQNVKPGLDEIRDLLRTEVLKRDVVEGEKADEARSKIRRAATKRLRVQNGDAKKSAADVPAEAEAAAE